MRLSHLSELLKYLRTSNDKAFVVDPESDLVFVLMPWGLYQALGSKTGPAPVASPPAAPPAERLAGDDDENMSWDSLPSDWEEETKPSAFSPLSQAHPPFSAGQTVSAPKLEFDDPPPPRALAEENLSAVPHEAEEEKFYLEPVE